MYSARKYKRIRKASGWPDQLEELADEIKEYAEDIRMGGLSRREQIEAGGQ